MSINGNAETFIELFVLLWLNTKRKCLINFKAKLEKSSNTIIKVSNLRVLPIQTASYKDK